MKILKNTTLSDIELLEVGLTIPASGQVEVNTESFLDLAADQSVSELTPLINSGDIVVNTGSIDLSAADGIEFIKYPDQAASISFDKAGTNFLSDTVEGAIKESISPALAGGLVASDGTSVRMLNSSSSRLSTGEYRITFDTAVADASYPIVITLEANAGADDYITSYSNVTTTSFDVSVNEQDNGGSPGTPRDSAFSFLVPNISTQAGPENDHGALSGLGDDDHPQYLNNTRGDARYYTESELDSGQLDNRYYTEAEIDAQQQAQDDNLTDHINDPTDAHDASAISFDNTVAQLDNNPNNVQDAIEELKGFRVQTPQFQLLQTLNFDQYFYAFKDAGGPRSGDNSNGYEFGGAAPVVSLYSGTVISASAAIKGLAVSTGSPASSVNLQLELWKVGFNGQGSKLGDIEFDIDSSQFTIGTFWNSSVDSDYEANQTQNVSVTAGDLLGLKFIRQTGNSGIVEIRNATVVLEIEGSA